MSVDRHDRMNSSTMTLARMLPKIRWLLDLVQRRADVARLVLQHLDLHVGGQQRLGPRSSRSLTASITSTVFMPDCRCTCSTTAGLPSKRASVRTSFVQSTDLAQVARSAPACRRPWRRPGRRKSRESRHAAQRAQAQLAEARVDAAAGNLGVLRARARRGPA